MKPVNELSNKCLCKEARRLAETLFHHGIQEGAARVRAAAVITELAIRLTDAEAQE